MKETIYISLLLLASTLFQGCKEEGCTDPNAINFNAIADEDDGSCEYCNEAETQQTFFYAENLVEPRFGSSLFGEDVFLVEVIQSQTSGAIINCPNFNPTCVTEVKLTNISNFKMAGFDVEIFVSTQFSSFGFFTEDLDLEVGEDSVVFRQEINLLVNNCTNLSELDVFYNIFSGVYTE